MAFPFPSWGRHVTTSASPSTTAPSSAETSVSTRCLFSSNCHIYSAKWAELQTDVAAGRWWVWSSDRCLCYCVSALVRNTNRLCLFCFYYRMCHITAYLMSIDSFKLIFISNQLAVISQWYCWYAEWWHYCSCDCKYSRAVRAKSRHSTSMISVWRQADVAVCLHQCCLRTFIQWCIMSMCVFLT